MVRIFRLEVLEVAEGEGDVDAFGEIVDLAVGEAEADLDPGNSAWKAGISGATMRRPRPSGAVTTSAPFGCSEKEATAASDSSIASSTRLAVS